MHTERSLSRDQSATGGRPTAGRRVLCAGMAATVLAVFTSFLATPAGSQLVPLGGEFRVDTQTAESQRFPAVAADPDGDFVVVWADRNFVQPSPDGDASGVFAQRVAGGGNLVGTEFQVNTYTTGNQRFPAVAAGADGDFFVVWEGSGATGVGIFGQRYDKAAVPLGTEFGVNTGGAIGPVIAAAPQGSSLVAWWGGDDGGAFGGIFGQRYDGSGTQQGAAFPVNSYTTATQRNPAVAALADGGFVVAWESYGQDGSGYGVFGQRYDSGGARRGTEFQVNTYTGNSQRNPAIASDGGGDFVVVWESRDQDGSSYGVFAQRFDGAGAKQGTEFQVNTGTALDQRAPAVASDANGRVLVVWSSIEQDGDDRGIFGQELDQAGALVGDEFQVNTYTTAAQDSPAVAAAPDGTMLVVWDASARGVFAQRYGQAMPPPTVTPPVPTCAGDCNNDKRVAINELIIGVNIALESQTIDSCPSFDTNGNERVAINELILGVNNALGGCG